MFLDAVNCQGTSTYSRPAVKNLAGSSFDQQLCSAKAASGKYVVPLKNENFVFYIGHGDGQDVYVEYTAESTPENPVVRISGHSLKGAFDFTMNVNDINPQNASYAELCALVGHQQQSGMLRANAALGICRPTPLGMQIEDFMQKANYMHKSQQYLSSGKISESIHNQGNELLNLYQGVAGKYGRLDRSLSCAYFDRITYELLHALEKTDTTKQFDW